MSQEREPLVRTRMCIVVVLFTLSIFVLLTPGHFTTSMDFTAFRTALNLVENRQWGFSERITHELAQGKDGKYYSYEGLIIMLSPVPLVLISKAMGMSTGVLALLTNGIITAFVSLLLLLVAREMGYSMRTSLLLVFAYSLGTQALVHTKFLMPDPLASLVFLSIFLCFLKYEKNGDRKWLVFLGGLCGAAAHVRPDSFLFVIGILVGLFLIFKKEFAGKERSVRKTVSDITAFALPVFGFLVLFALYNSLRFGSILETGYTKVVEERGLASTKLLGDFQLKKLLLGLAGMWIIPNRSIFFLNPVLIFSLISMKGFWRKFRRSAIIIGVALVFYALLYANRGPYGFAGSAAWGQRYLLPMTAFMVLPMGLFIERVFSAGKRRLRILFIGVLVVSILIQIIGASQNYQNFQAPMERQFGSEKARIMLTMEPKFSLLLLNMRLLLRGHTDFMFYKNLRSGNLPLWMIGSLFVLVLMALISGYFLSEPILSDTKEPAPQEKHQRRRGKRSKRG
ncbi:MAG: phospholipid carrier-dependent glycosyltransferase [Gemmatimonadota bacterium]|nr:MAG: phospholipid carrier-dependent glycosyltransferase [Gemmatimonadota bacterium]